MLAPTERSPFYGRWLVRSTQKFSVSVGILSKELVPSFCTICIHFACTRVFKLFHWWLWFLVLIGCPFFWNFSQDKQYWHQSVITINCSVQAAFCSQHPAGNFSALNIELEVMTLGAQLLQAFAVSISFSTVLTLRRFFSSYSGSSISSAKWFNSFCFVQNLT